MTFWQILACLIIAVTTVYYVYDYLSTHYTVVADGRRMEVAPLRFGDASPERLASQSDFFHLTLCIRAVGCGMSSSSTSTSRGLVVHLKYQASRRSTAYRHLVYFCRREDGPYTRLDDFVTAELFTPRIQLEGDRLRYLEIAADNVLREVTCQVPSR